MVPLIGNKKGKTWTLFSLGFFLVATVLTFLVGTVEAANSANPVLIQQKDIGSASVKKAKPPTYRYTATTAQNAHQQGKVNAAKIFWDCRGTGCTTSGPWPQPSVRACQNLATLVGPIKSFGRSGHYLSAKNIKQCNQPGSLSANPQKSAGVSSVNLIRGGVQTTPALNSKDVRNQSQAFFNRLPVDAAMKTKLATGEQLEYQVLTNAFSGNSGRMERRSWRGQILLPDLKNSGRKIVIHTQSKTLSGSRARKQEVWVIENPDKSLSKQILNGAGQLAGNITFTKDGSVRIGLDVNGDKVADFYELQVSDGEHSILFSPAGQVAWERFMNGGANPLCTPDASSPGTSFVGGMISGSDKTAMQVVCGRSSGSQGGGGSTGGSSRGGGLSGNPGGRTMGALCKGALSQHRGAPGRSDIVMSDGSFSETVADAITSFIKNGFDREEDGMAAQIGRAILAPLYVPVPVFWASALDDLVSGGPIIGPIRSNHVDTRMPSAEDIQHRQHRQQRDNHNETRPAANAPTNNDANSQVGACDPTVQSCPATSDNPPANWVETAPTNGRPNGGGATDPGPDQQTDPDTALYNLCQARARSQAMWDANTKDTSYVHQLCENPASQPSPVGHSSSTTLGGSYGSSITLTSYCGQYGEQESADQVPGATSHSSNGRNCGRTESPGTDGRCHGVGNRFNGGSAGSVNVTYGAVIGFEPFNPGIDPDPK